MTMKSCAQIFAERGDPWITERDRKEYVVTRDENPEIDRHLGGKPKPLNKGSIFNPVKVKKPCQSPAEETRRLASINNRLNLKLLKLGRVIKVK